MKRRSFVKGGMAWLGATLAPLACVHRTDDPAPRQGAHVALNHVRRLHVVQRDVLNGRSQYVAITRDGGEIEAPIFHARRGDHIDFTLENRLPQPTTLHLHGLTLPESMDGAGFSHLEPGAEKRIRFDLRNRASLYWMHAHPHGFTAEQVHAGLAAPLVVHDAEDEALDIALRLPAGNRLALMLSDVRIAAAQTLPYAPSRTECLHGWFGNAMRVNGKVDANLQVAPGWVRLQLLNACNARGLLLQLESNAAAGNTSLAFELLGTDGGLLAAPVRLERVFLYPAERVDIAMYLSPGQAVSAVSAAFDPRHQVKSSGSQALHDNRGRYPALAGGTLCAESAQSTLSDGARLPLFNLRVSQAVSSNAVDGASGAIASLPVRLSALAETTAGTGSVTRRIRLDFDERTGFLIDHQPYALNEPGWRVDRGVKETWEIRASPIGMPHPMHLHGFQFRVLRRQGTFGPARSLATQSNGRLPTDLGYKDTVVLWPNETVWIEVNFSLPQDAAFEARQRYMFHCHNLEHEDGMMMRDVVVV